MASRAHITVRGRVQGVFFRDHTRRWAVALSLTGWVRNLDDGRVEIMAEGDENGIRSFIDKVREGPIYARVDDLDVAWETPSGEFSEFRITT
jgi:acylphosphatase